MNTKVYAFALLIFPFLFNASAVDAQEAKSLLWEISGNGLESPSYLYGTMHVADKRAFKFSKSVMPSFEGAQGFAMELHPDDIDPTEMMEMMKLKEGKLEDMFAAEQWDSLSTFMREKYHTDMTTFNDFSPFFLYSMMIQSSFKSNMGEALDLYFYKQAKRANKELAGLETIDEQIGAINTMDKDAQVRMVMDMVAGKDDGGKKAMKKMLKYYMKGDLEKLMKLSEEADMGDDFEMALIVDRNHRMAERMEPLMKSRSTFVAVGALHLPGEEGVIQLLRKSGYTVRALQ
ncbi:MAG: TraB/GumN family protein [Bacteroidota bacterium]